MPLGFIKAKTSTRSKQELRTTNCELWFLLGKPVKKENNYLKKNRQLGKINILVKVYSLQFDLSDVLPHTDIFLNPVLRSFK